MNTSLEALVDVVCRYRAQHGSWPSTVLLPPHIVAAIRSAGLTPRGWSRLCGRVTLQETLGVAQARGQQGHEVTVDATIEGASITLEERKLAAQWLGVNKHLTLTQLPRPGYTTDRPHYPAFRALAVVAGTQDMYVDLVEVGLRHFENAARADGNERVFVDAVAKEVGVRTNYGQWMDVRGNGHRFAVAQAMSIADSFLRRLGREFRAYHPLKDWTAQRGGEQLDALDALIANMPTHDAKLAKGCPEYQVLQYYRGVRNRVIHQTSRDTDKDLKAMLDAHGTHMKDCYGMLPGAYKDISHRDFTLLTRATKYYSRVLNQACNLTVVSIVQFHLDPERQKSRSARTAEPTGPDHDKAAWLNAIRRCKGSEDKLDGLVEGFCDLYALTPLHANELRERLGDFLRSDPPRKQRKRIAQQP